MTERRDRSDSAFLAACRRERPAHVPLWVMRQAGRYLPEYMKLKERYTFLEMSQTAELIAEVTLQPLRRFPMDAAIVFADIMTSLHAIGLQIDFKPGPVVANPVRSRQDLDTLRVPEPEEIAPFLEEGLRTIAGELPSHQALIGFAGAPFTLFCYVVEGGGSKDFMTPRALLRSDPDTAGRLLDLLADTQVGYLRMQARAGADALMLFDSWAGLLSEAEYREHAMPRVRGILDAVRDEGVPLIYFPFGGSHLLPAVRELDADVVGIDWRTPLGVATEVLGDSKAVQGNLNPAALFASPDVLEAEAHAVLHEGASAPGHIFNLGHGIDRRTNPDQVARLVDLVHEWRPQR